MPLTKSENTQWEHFLILDFRKEQRSIVDIESYEGAGENEYYSLLLEGTVQLRYFEHEIILNTKW